MSTKLQVDIVADARGVAGGINEAEGRFSRFGSKVGQIGKAAALGLGAIGVAAAGAAVKLTQMAIEDEAAASKLANSLKNSTGATRDQIAATEDWISRQGVALGVTDDELRPAIERLASSTGSLKEAQDQASLAMDIAAGRGVSLETVTKALERANNGSVSGLSRLGVATKDAAGETLSLDQITKNLADTYQGAAATAANTTAGRFGRLKLQMGELGEEIGAKLLPFANRIAEWALRMLPAAQRLGTQLAAKLGPAFRRIGEFITDTVVPAAQRFYTWFIEKIAPGVVRYVTPILAAVQRGFGKLQQAISDNEPELRRFGAAVQRVGEFIANNVLPILGKLVGFLVDKVFGVLSTGIDWFSKLTGWILDAAGAVSDLVGWIKEIDFPDAPDWLTSGLDFITGSAGGLTRMTTRLAGGSPTYDNRGGWSTASAGMPSLAGWMRSAATGAAVTPALQVNRFDVQLDGRLVDPMGTARALEQLLRQYGFARGTTNPLGATG